MKHTFILLVVVFLESCSPNGFCLDYEKYYKDQITGRVIRKYRETYNYTRLIPHIVVRSQSGTECDLRFWYEYDETSVNDSVSKDSSSLLFKLFREGKIIKKVTFQECIESYKK